ncbi:MAG: hypothetical protein H0V30_08890 [Chitinophagaceae bacterium]|jgi:hypothetical protein|nr:hypothetical protein [Chitinophagaceae bacterium]
MKKRLSILNILASAILALALYLNFVHKDSGAADFGGNHPKTLIVHSGK